MADGGRPGFENPVLLVNTLTPALSLEGRGRGFSLPAWRVDMLYVIVDDAQDDDKA